MSRVPGVDDLTVGTRVAMARHGTRLVHANTAGRAGRPCARSQRKTGYSMDAGFAEYALGFASYVGRVPDGIDPLPG